jgi:hypothetical protein
MFSITDNGSDLFRVSTTQIESAVPHAFTAAGDVSIAYDLEFTNQTSSNIKSLGPLTIESGESFENLNLTLKTYGTGDFVFDNDGTTQAILTDTGMLGLGVTSSPISQLYAQTSTSSLTGRSVAIFDQNESEDILTASASGTTRFTIGNNGDLDINFSTSLTSGNGIALDWDGSTSLAGAATGIDITATDITGNGQNFYGINISDLGTAGAGNEYGIYVQGTDWDAAAYFEDDVGIGQATPLYKLHVTDTDTATASAWIENTYDVGADDSTALVVKIGSDADNPATTDRFINFMRGDSTIVGSIRGDGSGGVDFATNGTDFAEYFKKADSNQIMPKGALICASKNNEGVTTCDTSNNQILGVVSTSPGFTGGLNHENDPGYILTGLVGQIPVNVTTENGVVSKGDPITASGTQAGAGTKASVAGRIVGYALENVQGNDQVLVYVNPGWYDPNVYLTNSGELSLVADTSGRETGNWKLEIGNSGEFITNEGSYSNFIAANVKAGLAEITNIVAESIVALEIQTGNLLATIGIETPQLRTQEISPLEGSDLVLNLDQTPDDLADSEFGKLVIKGQDNEVVVGIDEVGNATFSGEIAANDLKVGRIYADEIFQRNSTSDSASFGDLLTREQIELLLAEAEADQKLLDDTQSWETNTATGSALLNELAATDLFVTGQAAVEQLSITNSMVVGNDLVVSSQVNELTGQQINSVDTINGPLSLQSSGSQPLYLMAGMVRINTEGDVEIDGNLYVAGSIESSGLTLRAGNTPGVSGGSHSGGENHSGSVLSVKSEDGSEVASITASGSAEFKELAAETIKLSGDSNATSSATLGGGLVFESTATAGTSNIPSGTNEVVIKNPNISNNTLIYITPTSSTQNQVLYLKSKEGCESGGIICESYFVVGFDEAISSEVEFNWWLVDLVAKDTGGTGL